jgi:hypothetical protein
MNTTGVRPEALALSICWVSRSVIWAMLVILAYRPTGVSAGLTSSALPHVP